MAIERIEYTGANGYRSTRFEREEVEARSHLKRTMRELGWRCVRHTGTGKPNRFEKIIPGHKPFYVTSAPMNHWRLEQDSGYVLRVQGMAIRQMVKLSTHRFQSAVGMALWLDYIGTALLKMGKPNGN